MESGRVPAGSRTDGRVRVRVAACTALALAAGVLLSAPGARADAHPGPHRGVQRPAADVRLPGIDALRTDAGAGAAFGARDAAAAPRSDVDGDGLSDMIVQDANGVVQVSTGDTAHELVHDDGQGSAYQVYKDVFSTAGLRTDGPVHFTLSASGRLSAYANDAYTPSRYWSGGGWQIYNKVFSPGDLTGDGAGDVLARTFAGALYLYPGTAGDGPPLGGRTLVGGGWNQFDQLVGMNDVDDDGIADLFARNTAGELYFYRGTGEAARPFEGKVLVGSGWNMFNALFSIDDLDADGRADLLARTVGGALYRYSSTGAGGFTSRVQIDTGWNAVNQFANAGNVSHWGKEDLAALDAKGTLWWYLDRNDGTFSAREQISGIGGWKGAVITVTSSLDDDSYPEILQLWEGGLYTYGVDGDAYRIGGGWGVYNTLVGPGDLSGDGKGDLVARDGSGTLYLYRGNGYGTGFASKQKVGTGWGRFDALLGAGDLSGDGRADLVARAGDGRLYLYEGTGNAASPFRGKKLIGSGWGSFTALAAPGDMNGDGRADLVARGGNGTLHRYDADGKGNFRPRATVGSGWNTYSGLY
ncbi:FG-GAP-like repeat-containing protein [Streptomyces sp. t39]|uniref:FG-GAP-like repeat-containing protein n=1 Tax=Streptomyces sp. t39 TaxID=1828156 RepID=UPI0021C6D55F|nr:FG-GAP-like repeat-containing protein [Streptomyces sp. t39]